MDPDILESLGTNPTQLLGLVAFASASIACIFAKKSSPTERRAWIVLAAVNAASFVEILFGFRHRVHADIVSVMLRIGLYEARAGLQYGLIVGSAALPIFAALSLVFFSKLRKPKFIVATFASFAVVTLFAIEAISFHRIDEIFYQEIGPVLLVGWLWCAACVAIILSARI